MAGQTLEQRRLNKAFADSRPTEESLLDPGNRALAAVKAIFKQYEGTPLVYMLNFFGPEIIAKAGLLLYPLSRFANKSSLISYANRRRTRVTRAVLPYTITEGSTARHTRNHLPDEVNYLKEEYVVSFSDGRSDTKVINDFIEVDSCHDTTSDSRKASFSQGYPESLSTSPPYGCLEMVQTKVSQQEWMYFRSVDEEISRRANTGRYDRYVVTQHCDLQGPCATASSPLFVPEWWNAQREFTNSKIAGLLPKALANARVYNPVYQLAEFKDLRSMATSVLTLKEDLQKLIIQAVKDPYVLAKGASNAFLGLNFGALPLVSSVQDLVNLPAKSIKRFNYLLDRAGKATTSRAKQKYSDFGSGHSTPTFNWHLPDWIEILDENVDYKSETEIRIVVGQTIVWPKIAEPTLGDDDYRRIFGADPSLGDLYQLIPWTWMFDWFTGLGDYIYLVEAIYKDPDIINYGLVTAVTTETVTHTAKLRCTNHHLDYTYESGEPHVIHGDFLTHRDKDYRQVYTRKINQRWSLGDFDGVKQFGIWQQNLSDFQTKILGALFFQRT